MQSFVMIRGRPWCWQYVVAVFCYDRLTPSMVITLTSSTWTIHYHRLLLWYFEILLGDDRLISSTLTIHCYHLLLQYVDALLGNDIYVDVLDGNDTLTPSLVICCLDAFVGGDPYTTAAAWKSQKILWGSCWITQRQTFLCKIATNSK